MKKQQKKQSNKKISKNQELQNPYKFVIFAVCVLLIILVILMVIVLIQQNNQKHDSRYYNGSPEQTTENINKTPTDKITGPSNEPTNTSEYISADHAIDIALEKVGTTRQNVRDLDAELDYEFGQKVYEVTFDYNQYEYEHYINPVSGEIIKSFKEIDY